MLPQPRSHPRPRVLAHVEVEQVIIDNVVRRAERLQARDVQARVAGAVWVIDPEDAAVALGGGEVRVEALEAERDATAIEGGGGVGRVERPGEGVGGEQAVVRRVVGAAPGGVPGDDAAGLERIAQGG